jgi:hypothetical protein
MKKIVQLQWLEKKRCQICRLQAKKELSNLDCLDERRELPRIFISTDKDILTASRPRRWGVAKDRAELIWEGVGHQHGPLFREAPMVPSLEDRPKKDPAFSATLISNGFLSRNI